MTCISLKQEVVDAIRRGQSMYGTHRSGIMIACDWMSIVLKALSLTCTRFYTDTGLLKHTSMQT